MRNFDTVEKLLKSVKSDTTATTLSLTNIEVSGVGSITGDLVNYGSIDTPLIYTAEIIGNGSGTPSALGAIGTAVAPTVDVVTIADEIITTINIDLTGMKTISDINDVIGVDGDSLPAYLTQVTEAINGVVYKTEMICTELPTAASNALTDIDLASAVAADAFYGTDGAAYTQIIDSNGEWALGLIKTSTAGTNPTKDDYLYLCDGATHTAASVFTGGQFVIRLYGYAVR